MPIETPELRRVMGHFATGVTVITTHDGCGNVAGLTANSLCSVSLEPPLLLICVDKTAECYPFFERSGVFVVNILAEEQEEVSRRFATRGADKFTGTGYRLSQGGCPILDRSIGHLECKIARAHEGGDHTIYLAEVTGGDAEERPPLLFYRGGYRKIAS